MKNILFSFLTLAISLSSWSQETYFQQEVNYKIRVALDDIQNTISGNIEFEYVNNSPDTLSEIYIHLWPNAYKNDKTALAKQLARDGNYYLSFAINKNKGSIDSLDFAVNEEKVNFSFYKNQLDIALIALPKPLAPGKRILVSTPFRVHIPIGTISRLGHIGQSYQITQWYPKPAVYDANGWNPLTYLTQGEFYSEFGTFDVEITLPENYTVGATGVLETTSEMDRLNLMSQMPFTSIPKEDQFPPSSKQLKTLRYAAENVHDFGWFADKRWIVRKGEVVLPKSGRTVTTWAMFTPQNATLWEKGVSYINETILTYSEWVGEYPYPQCTAVDGTISAGGGMEYPMVTVIGNSGNDFGLETVIVHEVGHNWFYGILGSNERENGWMDEGINSFMETRTLEIAHPEAKVYNGLFEENIAKFLGVEDFPLNYQNEILYQLTARSGNDQPIQTSSADFTSMNYGSIMYKKTGLAFNQLRNYLGDEMFKQCMNEYFENWKFKHPTPSDIQRVFEETSNKDLSWFFEQVIKGNGAIDYKISSTSKSETGYSAVVFNAGTIAAPFSVAVFHEGTLVDIKWYEGIAAGNWVKVAVAEAEKGDIIRINSQPGSLDIDRNNNNSRTKGIFRNQEPLSLSFFTGVDDPNKTRLFWLPVAGWNNYDKWMYGINIHNKTLPLRKFNFSATPMYSFSTNRIMGLGNVEMMLRNFSFGIKGKTFSYDRVSGSFLNDETSELVSGYYQVNPYVEWKARQASAITGWGIKVRWDGFYIKNFRDDLLNNKRSNRTTNPNAQTGTRIAAIFERNFIGGGFVAKPSISYLSNSAFVENAAFMLQTKTVFTYLKKKNRKVILKTFAAGTRGRLTNFPLMWGGTIGRGDVFFEGLYLGRTDNSGILSNQIISNQGGVLMPINPFSFGSPKTMITAYGEIDLPIKLPIALFAGVGAGKDQDALFSAGLTIPVKRDMIQIYAPLLFSSNIQSKVDGLDFGWQDYIMFELNLDLMNPFNFLKDL